MSLPLVAILGKAGAGKSTLAEKMVRRHGGVCVAWADPLKRLCVELTGLPEENVYGPSEKREEVVDVEIDFDHHVTHKIGQSAVYHLLDLKDEEAVGPLITWAHKCRTFMAEHGGLTARYALQQLGTEWGRAIDPEIWVKAGIRTGLALLRGGHDYVDRQLVEVTGAAPVAAVYYPDTRFANEVTAVKSGGGWVLGIKGQEISSNGDHSSELGCDAVPAHFIDAGFDNSQREPGLLTAFVCGNPVIQQIFKSPRWVTGR